MDHKTLSTTISVALTTACAATVAAQTASDRIILAIHEPQIPYSTVFDVRNARPPQGFEVTAAAGDLKLNYLCRGLKKFYAYAMLEVERISGALRRGTAQPVRRM
jgi:hypothetical protein